MYFRHRTIPPDPNPGFHQILMQMPHQHPAVDGPLCPVLDGIVAFKCSRRIYFFNSNSLFKDLIHPFNLIS